MVCIDLLMYEGITNEKTRALTVMSKPMSNFFQYLRKYLLRCLRAFIP